jgi:hypothetical protein
MTWLQPVPTNPEETTMKIRSFALALAVLAAPAPLLAQDRDAPRPEHRPGLEQRGPGRRNPVERLLRRREQLNLSADQVRRLEAIQQRVESQNRPLIERLQALHGNGPRQRVRRGELTEQQRAELRAQAERIREQARPTREQLRQNLDAARREVEAVLTDAQKQQIRQWAQERGNRRGPGRHGDGPRRRGEHERREHREHREHPQEHGQHPGT